ncbi:MAG: hypothetical protein LUB59_01510, partial [Candidatus Gastranaerophilales bacterium]|nr:hypothetical protein [Candidatus Gastranaerophilales bacterium]
TCIRDRILALLILTGLVGMPAYAEAVIFKSATGYGLKDGSGKVVLKPVYQSVSQCTYTPSKRFIVPMHAMDEVQEKKLELFKIKKNNLYGTAASSGRITNPCKYKDIEITDNGEVKLHTEDDVKYANPVKNAAKNTGNTMITIIALPVTIVGAVMMPIEAVSKMGRKE